MKEKYYDSLGGNMIKQKELRVCDECGHDEIKGLVISVDIERYAFPRHNFCGINCFIKYVSKNPDKFIFIDVKTK